MEEEHKVISLIIHNNLKKGLEGTISATVPTDEKFMPNLIDAYEMQNKKAKKRKEMDDEKNTTFQFKYREGYSAAVRYDLKIGYFFRSYNPLG